jgi:diadenosine tetraphosphate (Ap4A) HIT family hydrolase
MRTTHDLMRKFDVENLGIKDFENWIVAVRGKQITLGACVILLKRPEPSLGGLTSAEATELPEVAAWWESEASDLWKADRFNYIAAMMKDHFVHFHAIPRYETAREFQGQEFVDQDWPGLIEFRDVPTPREMLFAIRDRYIVNQNEN